VVSQYACMGSIPAGMCIVIAN